MIEMYQDMLSLSHMEFPLVVERQLHQELVENHSHDFVEFVYMDRGFSIHHVENETSIVMTGDLFFVMPGIFHAFWKTVNNQVYNCVFYPKVLGEDLTELRKLPFLRDILDARPPAPWGKIHLPYPQRLEVQSLLKKMLEETKEDKPANRINAKAMLTQLLILLSRIQNEPLAPQALPKTESAGHILEVLTYCVDHAVTVGDMARLSGYSQDHFSKLFKTYTGISPLSYLNTLKISNAADLLLRSHQSISQVAEQSGFDDVNYFSRIFKKETGFTPTLFRQQFEHLAGQK